MIKMDLLDAAIPLDASAQEHPVTALAEALRPRIQELKVQGLSQAARCFGSDGYPASAQGRLTSR
jgi:hypothetical protein